MGDVLTATILLNGTLLRKPLYSETIRSSFFAEELPHLESRYEVIKCNILALARRQENLENELYQLNRYKEISANELESLREEVNRLRRLSERLENTEAYYKINKVVEKKVREIFDNKKLIIGMALSALITAIRNEPDRSLVRYLLNEEMDPSTNQYCHQKLSELAQKYYEHRHCIQRYKARDKNKNI